MVDQRHAGMAHVLAPEQLDQLLGCDFGVGGIDFPLDDPQYVSDAALARL
ncbi:MAG TPA: hypothetical protein VGO13_00750 [Solirubrobacterales bacterium]|nr:hypothetical protein [Solirubrobacterales bacterium]